MVLESVLVSVFYKWLTLLPALLVKEIVFSPLYIFASFVKDKVSTGTWIYLCQRLLFLFRVALENDGDAER